MHTHSTAAGPAATAADLERAWRALGFTDGPPAHVAADIVAEDVRSYRGMACAACGRRGHEVRPMHCGREYRLLCRCRYCGDGTEA